MTDATEHRAAEEAEDRWMALPFRVRYEINTKATQMRKWLRSRRFQA